MEYAVKSEVANYINSISKFNADYLESTLLTNIVKADSGIVSADIIKKLGFKVSPIFGKETTFSKYTNNAIVPSSISSTLFNILHDGEYTTVSINEVPGKSVSVKTVSGGIEVIDTLGLYTKTGELIKEIGTVNLVTGKFDLTFSIASYLTGTRFVLISFETVSPDIITNRNQILAIDTIVADIAIGRLENNVVTTEIYSK
jgi:hypothetical protein